MKQIEIYKRYFVFVVSLFFAALGVAFTKHGELGVSPISSVANVMSIQFTNLSIGMWLIIWNCVLILGQIVLLKKNFKWYQMLQIPLSFLFGYFTDFGMWCVRFVPVENYGMQLACLIAGIIILSFGVSLSVCANVIMNSGEAFVKTIADVTHKNFGNVKIVFDTSCVILAVILSIVFFDFKILGTREGTIISALVTGFVVKIFVKILRPIVEKYCCHYKTTAN